MNLNKVYIIGRLVADPEFRTTPNGSEVTTLRIATNRFYTNQSGQKQEYTEFHTTVAWGRLAQIANQYLTKGKLVMIEGRLQTRNWEGKDGIKRYMTEIIAENLQLGPRTAEVSTTKREITKEIKAQTAKENESQTTKEEDIPVVNEEEPPAKNEGVEETTVDTKEVPF